MFKKIGLPAIALLGALALAPHPAKAAVRVGVVIGRPPYTYPVYPVYPVAPVVPVAPPVYVEGGVVRRDFHRDWDRGRDFDRAHRDFRGHDRDDHNRR